MPAQPSVKVKNTDSFLSYFPVALVNASEKAKLSTSLAGRGELENPSKLFLQNQKALDITGLLKTRLLF